MGHFLPKIGIVGYYSAIYQSVNKYLITTLIFFLFVDQAAATGSKVPWKRRIGLNVDAVHITSHKNTSIDIWPKEPVSPGKIDSKRFSESFGRLCEKVSSARLEKYSALVQQEAKSNDIDPFLLAALVYDQSRCWPNTYKRDQELGRFGLTRIPLSMHARHLREGEYNYFIKESNGWEQKKLKLDKYRYNKSSLFKAAPNIYFAAAFLKIFKHQAASLDAHFDGVLHRHYISHWFYGDRPREVEPENRVLTARRRILEYYADEKRSSIGEFKNVPLYSPLDGAKRLVLDYFGNKRGDKKSLGHRGIDIDGALGEPVYAIAKGRVIFSGVDLMGSKSNKMLTTKEAEELTNSDMGPGGLYVHIRHENDFGTIYMHLDSLNVEYFEEVEAGQKIGTLGRSGTKKSGPHLHLEFRDGTSRVNPAAFLNEILVNPYKNKRKPEVI